MRQLRKKILRDVFTPGGSVSRLREEVYREAADLAYYFHWQKGDIMGMTMRERRIWLSQIGRIHAEQKKTRDNELMEQAAVLMNMKSQE